MLSFEIAQEKIQDTKDFADKNFKEETFLAKGQNGGFYRITLYWSEYSEKIMYDTKTM